MSKREAFLTMFGTGYIKRAPGTFGSLFALIPALPILYFSAFTLFLLSILIGVVAIKQVDIYEQHSHTHDAKHIVIDELVGMWIALSIAWGGVFGGVGLESGGESLSAATSAGNAANIAGFAPFIHFSAPFSALLIIVLSFVFFRLYDIWKPSIVGRVDREVGGGLGVVGDDALAGLLAGLSVLVVVGILGRLVGLSA